MKYAIGIDIGATITKIGLVSQDGKCIKKHLLELRYLITFQTI